jgi:hypothetical protein
LPIAAILLGAILIDLGVRGTEHVFGAQLEQDFGGGEFLAWAAAIGILGALAYAPALRKVSTAGLTLVLLGMILSNKGAFMNLAQVVENPPSPAPSVPLPSFASGGSNSGGGGGGSLVSDAVGALGDFAFG